MHTCCLTHDDPTAQHNTANPKNDMDVVELWDQGYDGKGVTVAVVDDGLYHAHNDIKDNYVRRRTA